MKQQLLTCNSDQSSMRFVAFTDAFVSPAASAFVAPTALVASVAVTVAPAAAIPAAAVAVAAPAAVAMPAAVNLRAAMGRNAAAAHAWDTTGGAPSFQAYPCTEAICGDINTFKTTTFKTTDINWTDTKTIKTETNKNKKRPQSWSGPPNG